MKWYKLGLEGWGLIILVLMAATMFALSMTAKYNLPPISLPKLAQHNTFGELPIVEMMDDGVFAEVDGAEYEVNNYWCDELNRGFTCSLKFGMSYDVARRIGEGELLDSCKEAKRVSEKTFEFCIGNYLIEDTMKNYNFSREAATKYYYEAMDFCFEQSKYIPECHGTYKDWLYDYHTGGLN